MQAGLAFLQNGGPVWGQILESYIYGEIFKLALSLPGPVCQIVSLLFRQDWILVKEPLSFCSHFVIRIAIVISSWQLYVPSLALSDSCIAFLQYTDWLAGVNKEDFSPTGLKMLSWTACVISRSPKSHAGYISLRRLNDKPSWHHHKPSWHHQKRGDVRKPALERACHVRVPGKSRQGVGKTTDTSFDKP